VAASPSNQATWVLGVWLRHQLNQGVLPELAACCGRSSGSPCAGEMRISPSCARSRTAGSGAARSACSRAMAAAMAPKGRSAEPSPARLPSCTCRRKGWTTVMRATPSMEPAVAPRVEIWTVLEGCWPGSERSEPSCSSSSKLPVPRSGIRMLAVPASGAMPMPYRVPSGARSEAVVGRKRAPPRMARSMARLSEMGAAEISSDLLVATSRRILPGPAPGAEASETMVAATDSQATRNTARGERSSSRAPANSWSGRGGVQRGVTPRVGSM
jgi:hypothetical protein